MVLMVVMATLIWCVSIFEVPNTEMVCLVYRVTHIIFVIAIVLGKHMLAFLFLLFLLLMLK